MAFPTEPISALPEKMPRGVYEFFDTDGVCLYVGQSGTPKARFSQHKSKAWWSEVVAYSLVPYETVGQVKEAEILAIINDNPLHNIQYKNWYLCEACGNIPVPAAHHHECPHIPAFDLGERLSDILGTFRREILTKAWEHWENGLSLEEAIERMQTT